jgi:FKBP-type peptidyl-prolyl cis-trans isomerase 2
MVLQKKDFIEIEFTARVKDGEIFDSNIRKDVEALHHGHDHEINTEPFIFCLGEGMFLPAVDEFLIGKPDDPASYEIELPPEKAFGERNPKLISTVPSRVFKESNMNPFPGAVFNFDGRVGKVLAVSGGRIMVDFNNPLAGKIVVYQIHVLRKVDDLNEKISAFIKFLFKRDLSFEVQDKKIILQVEKPLVEFANLFKDKFKELFEMDLELKENEEADKPGGKSESYIEEKEEEHKEEN